MYYQVVLLKYLSSSFFFHIAAFCSKRKVSYHFLHVWWFGNILYTIRKLSSRDLWGCMLYLCIFKFHLQKQGSSIIFFCIAAFCSKWKVSYHFCMSDGLVTYNIPLESSLQGIFEGSWFSCVILSFIAKTRIIHCFLCITALWWPDGAKTLQADKVMTNLFLWHCNILH